MIWVKKIVQDFAVFTFILPTTNFSLISATLDYSYIYQSHFKYYSSYK